MPIGQSEHDMKLGDGTLLVVLVFGFFTHIGLWWVALVAMVAAGVLNYLEKKFPLGGVGWR